jgi:MtN3 and saliva related transmembrane protein
MINHRRDGGCKVNLPAPLFNIFLHGVSQSGLVGYIAGACTTLAFIPQISKIRKQGGEDLSYGMLGMYLIGLILWLLYGMILHAGPVIVANVVSIMLVACATVMKATAVKRY